MSIFMRTELTSSGVNILYSGSVFNLLITMHGLVMIFFLIMPLLYGGVGNVIIPVLIGSPEVAYPRVNSISILLVPLGFLLASIVIVGNYGTGGGWTMYPPITTQCCMTGGLSALFLGLVVSGISTTLTSINFMSTLMLLRGIGLLLSMVNVYVVAGVLAAVLLVLTLPFLTGAILMIMTDNSINTGIFEADVGGDAILFQHLFWVFGHPEVYVMILPAFGVLSYAISSRLL